MDGKARLLDQMRDVWCSECEHIATLIKREAELRDAETRLAHLKASHDLACGDRARLLTRVNQLEAEKRGDLT